MCASVCVYVHLLYVSINSHTKFVYETVVQRAADGRYNRDIMSQATLLSPALVRIIQDRRATSTSNSHVCHARGVGIDEEP